MEELVYLFEVSEFDGGYLSIVIAICYFASVYGLEKLGGSTLFGPGVRGILADYSFVFPTLFWVGFSHIPGRLENTGRQVGICSIAIWFPDDAAFLLRPRKFCTRSKNDTC